MNSVARPLAMAPLAPLFLLLCRAPLAPAAYEASDPIEAPALAPVFVAGQGGYHTFRIPALVRAHDGSLLAFCEGRKTGPADAGDIDIVMRRSTDAGKTWDAMRVVHEEGGDAPVTIGNPCAVLDAGTSTLWLAFCRNNRDVFVTSTKDAGRTWAPPRDITATVKRPDWTWYATGPGVGIQLRRGPRAGRLVIPCDHGEMRDGKRTMTSHVVTSDDGGATWQLGGSVAPGTDECQVVELPDGALLLNMRHQPGRTDVSGCRLVSRSRDGGATWSPPAPASALVEPACQASLVAYDLKERLGRRLLLFTNPADARRRINATARLSYDGGRTWPVAHTLFAGPSGYSCLAPLPDGRVACLLEHGEKDFRERISIVRFNLHWLEELDAAKLPSAGLSLFDGKSLGQWLEADFGGRTKGVSVKEGAIHMATGKDMTGIVWSGPVPRTDYVIELEAMRVDGSDFFCALTFPVGSDPCTFVLGGWGGSVVGLSSLDFLDASENETCQTLSFDNGRWYKVRVRVTAGRMQASIDDDELVDVQTEGRKIGIRFEVEPCRPLGVATWCTSGAVRNITLRPAH